jgi:hypothetical protein
MMGTRGIWLEGFQRRRLKCEKLTDNRRQVMAKAHIAYFNSNFTHQNKVLLVLINKHGHHRQFLFLIGRFLKIFSETA